MRQAQRFILGAGLLALPFVFSVRSMYDQMREPKAVAMFVMVGLLVSLEVMGSISFVLGCSAFVVYLWSILFSAAFPYSSLLAFSGALCSCLFVSKASKNDIKIGLELLEISGLLCVAWAALQYLGLDPIQRPVPGADMKRVMVFFGQHTLYGPYAAACLAHALFRGRYIRAAILFLPLLAINASFTFLSAAVVVSIFLVFRFGKSAILGLLLMTAIAGGIGGYLYRNQDYVKYEALDSNGRFALWEVVYRIANSRPLLGHGGLGSFSSQFPVFQSRELREANGIKDEDLTETARSNLKQADDLRKASGFFLSAHNEFLEAFYEFGYVGLLLSLWLVLTFLWWWLVAEDSIENWVLGAIFFSFMANSLGNFALHLVPQGLLPLWAFVLVTTDRDRGILEA